MKRSTDSDLVDIQVKKSYDVYEPIKEAAKVHFEGDLEYTFNRH